MADQPTREQAIEAAARHVHKWVWRLLTWQSNGGKSDPLTEGEVAAQLRTGLMELDRALALPPSPPTGAELPDSQGEYRSLDHACAILSKCVTPYSGEQAQAVAKVLRQWRDKWAAAVDLIRPAAELPTDVEAEVRECFTRVPTTLIRDGAIAITREAAIAAVLRYLRSLPNHAAEVERLLKEGREQAETLRAASEQCIELRAENKRLRKTLTDLRDSHQLLVEREHQLRAEVEAGKQREQALRNENAKLHGWVNELAQKREPPQPAPLPGGFKVGDRVRERDNPSCTATVIDQHSDSRFVRVRFDNGPSCGSGCAISLLEPLPPAEDPKAPKPDGEQLAPIVWLRAHDDRLAALEAKVAEMATRLEPKP